MSVIKPPQLGSKLTLLSAWFCPFAQRTYIAANEKGIPFTLYEVALKDATGQWKQLAEKPEWFVKLNPLGKVPVLAWKEEDLVQSVYESLVCNEFLEDFAPEPAMLPPHPATKATARIIMDRFNAKFVPNFYRILIRQDKESQNECASILQSELGWLETSADSAGPYFMGQNFSLVDAALLPWFLRLPILQHYRGFQWPEEQVPRLTKWVDAAAQRPSVQATMHHPEGLEYNKELLDHYSKYADASAKSTSATDFK